MSITYLRNSGTKHRQWRDNAVLARPGKTAAGPSTGNEAAALDATNEPTTRTEHLCRVREAHRVSLCKSNVLFLFSAGHRRNSR